MFMLQNYKTMETAGQIEEKFMQQAAEKQKILKKFWSEVSVEINLKKNNKVRTFFPLMRMRTIMKLDLKGPISTEATAAMSFLCELFIRELTSISWLEAHKRQSKTICKLDTVKAAKTYDHMDFLVDTLPAYVPLFYGNHRRYKPKAKALKDAINVIKVVEQQLQNPTTYPLISFNQTTGTSTGSQITLPSLQCNSRAQCLPNFPNMSFNQSAPGTLTYSSAAALPSYLQDFQNFEFSYPSRNPQSEDLTSIAPTNFPLLNIRAAEAVADPLSNSNSIPKPSFNFNFGETNLVDRGCLNSYNGNGLNFPISDSSAPPLLTVNNTVNINQSIPGYALTLNLQQS